MISVERREEIRRAYFVEHKSVRQIAKELKCGRETIDKCIASAEALPYTLQLPRAAPVLGPYKARIAQLLAENGTLPRKQRYTGHRIYQIIKGEGFPGSESGVRRHVACLRKEGKRPPVYLPLEFDPGADAQVDWGGEAIATVAGERVTVQLFYMRLCYSRRLFMMAFPTQKQEAFFAGHVQAFHFFNGVPKRLSYDNLKAAVQRVLEGRTRQEQAKFVVFRSHYLFESHFCTPGQGHEKGVVEHGVGFGRRNFMVPPPNVASYAELNDHLLAECLADDQRQVKGQEEPIGMAWQREKTCLRPLPEHDFACCVSVPVALTPYSQVIFDTNRYSVPADDAYRNLVVKAYPFRIDVLHLNRIVASHPRCYGRNQDVFDPLHYLSLLEQRPGAFDHAKPMRRWRESWPPIYEQLLARLKSQGAEGRGVREFVRILKLHRDHPATLVEQAIAKALDYGCAHADGVTLCLHQLLHPEVPPTILEAWPSMESALGAQPVWAAVGAQPLDLRRYDQLLVRR